MKKIITIFVTVFCLGMGMMGCAATPQEEEIDIVGTWELQSVEMNGITYVDAEYLVKYDYSFTFHEDGIVEVNSLGVKYTTTYSISNGRISLAHADLASVKLEVVDNTLRMQLSETGIGATLVFERK